MCYCPILVAYSETAYDRQQASTVLCYCRSPLYAMGVLCGSPINSLKYNGVRWLRLKLFNGIPV